MTTLNVEAFNAVADVIEYADRFDLSVLTSDDASATQLWEECGTTGCIAGWVCAWLDVPYADVWAARDELGISHEQSGALFFNGDRSVWRKVAASYGWKFAPGRGDHDMAGAGKITAAQAADVLRRIARGEVKL